MFQNWKALSFNGGVEKMTPREKEKKGAVEKKDERNKWAWAIYTTPFCKF